MINNSRRGFSSLISTSLLNERLSHNIRILDASGPFGGSDPQQEFKKARIPNSTYLGTLERLIDLKSKYPLMLCDAQQFSH
jgi:thiosulfate/3-mercaptopyruvate sulfurtransferase